MGKRRQELSDLDSETAEEWEQLKTQPGLIVVDVYAKWAGPCDIMKPVIIKIKLKGQLYNELSQYFRFFLGSLTKPIFFFFLE